MRVLCVALFIAVAEAISEDASVETNVGTFIGFTDKIDVDGTPFHLAKFLGIPFAEAPVGDLRFRKPVQKSPLSEALVTKRFGSPCMQLMSVPKPQSGLEDCLYLNVYAPALSLNGIEKIPVMVYLHGGGFTLGSASTFIPDRLVANGPVIVVTMNYRLSVWGFLATGDSNSPGNYGLWDQQLAIKWVHDNIENFGGDPNRVTIFGESAGSTSVIYQGFYPGNKGLFQRLIAQSGSPLAAWGKARAPVSNARDFALLAGCGTESNEKIVDCLRALDNSIINATLNDFSNGLAIRPMIFIPYPDNDFVIEDSSNSKETFQPCSKCNSVFSSFDLLTGVVSGEAYLFTPPSPWQQNEHDKFLPNRTFLKETLFPRILKRLLKEDCNELLDTIMAEYTDWDDPDNPKILREKYCDAIGDMLFLEPMWRTIDLHADRTHRPSSYMYSFSIKPSSHYFPTPSWATKPNHGDDLIYVFGGEADVSEFGKTETISLEDWEKTLSTKVMTIWTNFAKTGNPNRPRDLDIDWIPYTGSHQHYLDISRTLTSRSIKTRLEGRRMNLWNKIVPSIIQICKDKSSNMKETCNKEKGCSP